MNLKKVGKNSNVKYKMILIFFGKTSVFFLANCSKNGASHDTKIIDCIRLVKAGAKKYKYSSLICAGLLRIETENSSN